MRNDLTNEKDITMERKFRMYFDCVALFQYHGQIQYDLIYEIFDTQITILPYHWAHHNLAHYSLLVLGFEKTSLSPSFENFYKSSSNAILFFTYCEDFQKISCMELDQLN